MLNCRADDWQVYGHALGAVRAVNETMGSMFRAHGAPESIADIDAHLNAIAECWQARPASEKLPMMGKIGRMVDPVWWSKNVRRELLRENENFEHAAGAVRKKTQCYVSDHAVMRVRQRAKQNRLTLERMEAVNELGQALTLADASDASVSNPAVRRSELMVRCRGFEEVAQFMGHQAVFLTLTCPSRFHRFNAAGKDNENWTGQTPRDGQDYLNQTWQKIRAAWKRAGYAPYGFRVAEPHHDGCPHWHILLFAPTDEMGWFVPRRLLADRPDFGAGIVGIAGRYALKDSPAEPGAVKHRFTSKMIDPSQGSATGYIAKYISKNIDGLKDDGSVMGVDFDSATGAEKAAQRVRAWAAVHGIRQFQQIGGPLVTVWRELRRLKEILEAPHQADIFENVRAACDRACWLSFWMLQGGPDAGRAGLIKPVYLSDDIGKYGDTMRRVSGVQDAAQNELVTRLHTWTVQRAGTAENNAHDALTKRIRARFGAAGFDILMGAADPVFLTPQGEAAQPWTGVNNCTQTDENDRTALQIDRMRSMTKDSPGGEGQFNLESYPNERRKHLGSGSGSGYQH